MNKPVVYTLGHSTHTLDFFLELLQAYSINFLIDVRSVAASSYNPKYNKIPLSHFLKSNQITYSHYGEEFGARNTAADILNAEGRVDFELVRQTPSFKKGVNQLIKELEEGYRVALMCSESDPLDCHRFSMISIALEKQNIEVLHILKDKTIKSNTQLENQLLKKYAKKIPQPDLFQPNVTLEDQLTVAYRLHNREVAYSPFLNQPVEDKYD